jgi:hypothetical protein
MRQDDPMAILSVALLRNWWLMELDGLSSLGAPL